MSLNCSAFVSVTCSISLSMRSLLCFSSFSFSYSAGELGVAELTATFPDVMSSLSSLSSAKLLLQYSGGTLLSALSICTARRVSSAFAWMLRLTFDCSASEKRSVVPA